MMTEVFQGHQWYPSLEHAPDLPKPRTCECCGQLIAPYKRRIHTGMALVLIRLWHLQRRSPPFDEFWHVTAFDKGASRGDFAKLRFWGLIRVKDSTARRCSYYRLTYEGVKYATGTLAVPKICRVLSNEVIDYVGPAVTIHHALDHQFSYDELIARDNPEEWT